MSFDFTRSQTLSVTLHTLLLMLVLLLPSLKFDPLPDQPMPAAMPLTPRKLIWRAHEGGGGAQQDRPATAGRVQVVLARRPLLPPVTRPLDHTPKMMVETGISVDVPMPVVQAMGDPLSMVKGPPSGGRGPGKGLGDGPGDGIGPGGNAGLGSHAERWRGVTAPVVIYQVEPEYPDEARKARFQGSVLVAVEVDEQGLVRSVRIMKPAGLGLDEKALEAVKKWRFRPATRDGHPVSVPASIEVSFHLL